MKVLESHFVQLVEFNLVLFGKVRENIGLAVRVTVAVVRPGLERFLEITREKNWLNVNAKATKNKESKYDPQQDSRKRSVRITNVNFFKARESTNGLQQSTQIEGIGAMTELNRQVLQCFRAPLNHRRSKGNPVAIPEAQTELFEFGQSEERKAVGMAELQRRSCVHVEALDFILSFVQEFEKVNPLVFGFANGKKVDVDR